MKTYLIKTYGCKLNQAETDGLIRALPESFQKASEKKARVVILNTCGVIDKTERKIIKEIKKQKKKGKKVVVTGCLPAINPEVKSLADLSIVGNDPIDFSNKISQLFKTEGKNINGIPALTNPKSTSAIIPISTGCLGSCSYCSAKLARGKLRSYPKKEIMEKAKQVLKSGKKEIQLTSQDLGVYGMESGEPMIIDLIRGLLNLNEDFRLKLGMMNPGHVNKFFDDFLDLFESEKLYNFIHLPVQSGSEKVLKDMNRKHSVSEFKKMVGKIKSKLKNPLLSTDIIVGFPTETENDFQKTVNLIEETKPHIINITRYSERPKTEAAKLKDMPSKIKKERSRKVTKLAKKIRLNDNKKVKGQIFKTLIVRKGKNKSMLGRLPNGKAVVLSEGKVGEIAKIKIVDFKHNYLIGRNVQ